jgi:hypothetical protein
MFKKLKPTIVGTPRSQLRAHVGIISLFEEIYKSISNLIRRFRSFVVEHVVKRGKPPIDEYCVARMRIQGEGIQYPFSLLMSERYRDHMDDDREQNQETPWETPLIKNKSGSPIGVCIFLAKEDLATMGFDPVSHEEVYYEISDGGQIQLLETGEIS